MDIIDKLSKQSIPSLSVSQMKEIDRIVVNDFSITIQMMMEQASQEIADISSHVLKNEIKNKNILILCGKGNNGGDGIGAARYIKDYGGIPTIILSSNEKDLSKDAKIQLELAHNQEIKVILFSTDMASEIQKLFKNTNLVIDSLIGYSLQGNPKDPISTLIRLANESRSPILSIDMPTGLTGDKGRPSNPTIKATWTITLGLPKKGLYKKSAIKFVGELFLADLSIPKEAYNKINIEYQNPFINSSVIKLI